MAGTAARSMIVRTADGTEMPSTTIRSAGMSVVVTCTSSPGTANAVATRDEELRSVGGRDLEAPELGGAAIRDEGVLANGQMGSHEPAPPSVRRAHHGEDAAVQAQPPT